MDSENVIARLCGITKLELHTHEAVPLPPCATSNGLQGINKRCSYRRIGQHEPKAVGLSSNGRCFDWLGHLHAT